MNGVLTILLIMYTTADCASYQRYGETTDRYPGYTTISNFYLNPYSKSAFKSDVARFPEETRYPNYNPGYTTSSYDSYSSPGLNNFYQSEYSTRRYGQTYSNGYSVYEIPFMRNINDYCVNRTPQTDIWVDRMMGMWYGVEFIQHLAGDSRVDYSRTCIVIHISEPMDRPSTEHQLFHVQHINAKFRQDYRHLRLLWDEAGQTIEYALYFRNDSAGYWQVYDGQNGTLSSIATRTNYQQFTGTVQVLKAVNDHLVLNFCQEPGNGRQAQLYSVLFSRDPGAIARWEIDSVHSMLQNKKLSVASRRMVCGNNAVKPIYSLGFSIFTCVVAGFIASW